MKPMIEIAFLADYPDAIPTLTRWFLAQWPEYFAERTPADIGEDFSAEANRHGLPVRLVAFSGGELAGTITVRDRAMRILPECQPGLGGLFVVERYRGRGIATELVRAGMILAREQGYERIYAATAAAHGILERLGWHRVRSFSHGDEQLAIYRCELGEGGPTPHGAGPARQGG